MANKNWKDYRFKLAGNNTSALSDISAYVNQGSLSSAIDMLEDTGMGSTVTTKSKINGLSDITLDINGFVNSTTEGIFGPILKGTSVKKRCEVQVFTGRYYNGSVLPGSVQFSGTPATLQTFSANLNFVGTFNRTAVALT